MSSDSLLANLNQSQQAAVSSFADTVAILAGPGSGKTHTLTSRTAWLLAQGVQPWNIIVATFTVKAAREMKERIGKLLGNGLEAKLVLGTFHSISRRYLARYGHLIGIKKDFGIADSADSLAIIKRICKRNNFTIDPKVARSRISGRKSRGGHGKEKSKSGAKSVEVQEFDLCYDQYEEALKISNLLDYDDLLLRCVDLLRNHPSCASNVEAVLIDEFQDTNLVQFDLMRLFAAERKRITIVGDPDQSIYGFRAAEIKNYKRMLRQYPDTVTIALEENYRSSGAILMSALSVIQQDGSRVDKSLMPTHTVGTRPVLRKLYNAYMEAEWIVTEIKRCQGMTGGLMDLNDYAILLRSSSLSRLIEASLGKAGIAYRMVGGLKFYDRVEIKTILDYLRVINQPENNDALARIINTPSRRIGEATIKSLLEEADKKKTTMWALILGAVQGRQNTTTKLQKPAEQSLSKLVNIILTARKKLTDSNDTSTVDLIRYIMEKTGYEKWLEDHHGDVTKARWDNVQELITQASDFQDLLSSGYEDEALPEIEGLEQEEDDNHLSRFLANVALNAEVNKDDAEGPGTAQVTISTIHAAKGLEWPVVFIPAVYEGSIPHSRADDPNEERRLLYVAMTRAKALLYMSVPIKNSQSEETTLSPFVSPSSLNRLLEKKGPALGSSTVQSIAQILRRGCPTANSITECCSQLRSIEDNLFPEDGTEDNHPKSRFETNSEFSTYHMGQAQKRRKVELNRSLSNIEQAPERNWKPTFTTTMDRASGFTALPMTSRNGFVSAGSHLQVLNEQAAKAPPTVEKEIPKSRKNPSKVPGNQGNLMAFLGKPEPIVEPPRLPSRTTNKQSQVPSTTPASIPPDLASHRIGPSARLKPPMSREREPDTHPRNNYVFLSSSPPRAPKSNPNPNSSIPEKPAEPPKQGLMARPPLMSLIRPPGGGGAGGVGASLHVTSMDRATGSGVKRTLGVKRGLDGGWENRGSKGKGFRPPVLRGGK
ncbi:hypothetical protein HYALB_00001648 [Hymenoscyphus albidus]|uniref:DNA 3'-5' helicase n=1 Tax=Hymenoscyphus albidus TaxID=595503 RepID=A0A9N9LFK4_9HELO|nr:hypothetical protein HYALB_00001648 [Hymenoscyphus albidus]